MFHSQIYRPEFLSEYIDYFQFISKSDNAHYIFSTYQNTNYCLTIFKNNRISFNEKTYFLEVGLGKNNYSSFFDGFHKNPIHLNLSGEIDQICIVFKPGALMYFSNINSKELAKSTEAFYHIFGKNNQYFLEQLFEYKSFKDRITILESFFIKRMNVQNKSKILQNILQTIEQKSGIITLKEIDKKYNINRIKLYRKFNNFLGLSPKNFIETIRFRETLNQFKKGNFKNLTELSYQLGYSDQSHFITSFQKMAGTTPAKFLKNMNIVEETFVWTNLL